MSARKPSTPHLDIRIGLELDAQGREAARQHAAECPECAAKLDADDLVMDFLKLPPPRLSPGFVTRICANAVDAGTPTAPMWWVSLPLSWRLGFAALLVLAALGGYRAGAKAAGPGHATAAAAAEPACCAAPELAAMRVDSLPAPRGGGE